MVSMSACASLRNMTPTDGEDSEPTSSHPILRDEVCRIALEACANAFRVERCGSGSLGRGFGTAPAQRPAP